MHTIMPFTTQGNAFMGNINIFKSAKVVNNSEADNCRLINTVVVNVAKGTNTGIDAHKNTQIASRYFRLDKAFNSKILCLHAKLSIAFSKFIIFKLRIPRIASVRTWMRLSLFSIRSWKKIDGMESVGKC